MGGLLAYDLTILWKGARAAFSSKRDLLLLVCAGPIVLLVAAQGASNAVMALREVSEPFKMLIIAATALFVDSSRASARSGLVRGGRTRTTAVMRQGGG